MINKLLSHIDYKTLFNELGEGIVYVQQDGEIVFINNEGKNIFRSFPHFSPGKNIHSQPWQIFLKSGKLLPSDEFGPALVLKTGEAVHNSIVKLVNDAGDFAWVDINADPVGKNTAGGFDGVMLTIVELSDVMQEKQNLRYREEKFRIFFQTNEAATFLVNKEGKHLSVSKGAEKIFGYDAGELLQVSLTDILVADESFEQARINAEENGSVIAEVTGRRKIGLLFPVLLNATNFITSTGEELISIVLIDLQEKKETERAAKKTAFNLELILHNTDDAFLVTDDKLIVVTFNDAYVRTLKCLYGTDIQTGDYLIDLIDTSRKDFALNLMNDVLKGKKFESQRAIMEKGEQKIYSTEVRPLYDAGSVIGTFVQLKDVTDNFKMQEQLRQSNERFELAVKASYDLIWDIDLVKQQVQFNDVMEKVFLHPFSSPIPLQMFMKLVLYEEDAAYLNEAIAAFLHGPKINIEYPVHRLQKGDGSIAYVQVNAIKVMDEQGNTTRIIGVTRDMTEKYLLQQKLTENIERYSMARKATKDILYEYDVSSRSVLYSDSLYEGLGYRPDEITNMEMVERLLIHPDDVNLIRLKIKEFEEGKEDIFVYPDFRMLHKNGEVVFTEVKTIAVRSDTGRMIKAFGNIKNITERYLMQEQLRKSNERFELAARASYDILWDADLLRKNIFFSEGIKANLDIDGPLVITFNDFYTKMLHPDDVLPLQKAFIDLIRSKELNASLPCHRLKKADGSFAFVKAKMYGVRDTSGRLNRVIGVTTDITLQKQYEWNLEKLNSDLENQAHDLKQSNVELERFAYVASHDLQEPLRMVSSFLSLTKKRYADVLDDTGKQYIHFAVEGAERMKRLILDLLQFSKIGFNRLQKEEVNTQEICNDLRNEFIFTIKEKNATVVMDPLPSIVANKSQLIHVFRNLLGNALKYSAILPVVHIGCKEATDHWQFFVKDNGIGIDQKYFDKIFIIFQQLHVKNEYAGSGVGLAIAKKIVEQHGGRIWVESEKSHGSTFYFTIAKQ